MVIRELASYNSVYLDEVKKRLAVAEISPNQAIGQHFLVNAEAIDLLAQSVNPGSLTIEIGCGIGHVTELISKTATQVYGIEIDQRFRPLLDAIAGNFSNLHIIYGDALSVDYNRLLRNNKDGDAQFVASLPYHITEPFLPKIAPLSIESATLVVGRRYADSLRAILDSPGFGRLSILTRTFFDTETLATVKKDGFFPVPRADSVIVRLTPRDKNEIATNRKDVIFRHLFLTSRRNATLRHGLKVGFTVFEQAQGGLGLSKHERSRRTRREIRLRLREVMAYVDYRGLDQYKQEQGDSPNMARDFIDRLYLSSPMLDKPFSLLDNSELRMLDHALK